ncbi:DUF2570 domain-containing protein [Yersinia bercovieri]|uniref:DUF2570 domain-containing protein n=1 Tax=Yersinia bercovieri TaxID=634 RepID=UPI0011A827A2|nr:DUF2570 domain-containing protein [Yersinia bercovieri]
MPYKIVGGIITVLVAFSLMQFVHWHNLSKQVEKREKELAEERAMNVALGHIIDAYQENNSANRVAITRQLESERVIRNENEEKVRQFQAEAMGDPCAVQHMPDSIINLLQE